jgi:SdrD B-like protein
MSEQMKNDLNEQSRKLMDGPLKHIKAAALAAALLPLASVAATPASAQTMCGASGGVCGIVFNDTNGNGIQDAGEPGIEGVTVTVYDDTNTEVGSVTTNPDGTYFVNSGFGDYTVVVNTPPGTEASPSNVGSDDSIDSDGVADTSAGTSVATHVTGDGFATDFGFHTVVTSQPGTGTPGYWKNHPDAWPTQTVTVGGVTYTKDQAIAWLGKVGKDKTTTMFSSLVPAMLNVMIGNLGTCVSGAIADGNAWMATYGPVGSNVAASSDAWAIGEPTHKTLDAYNNGLLCAPHRQ